MRAISSAAGRAPSASVYRKPRPARILLIPGSPGRVLRSRTIFRPYAGLGRLRASPRGTTGEPDVAREQREDDGQDHDPPRETRDGGRGPRALDVLDRCRQDALARDEDAVAVDAERGAGDEGDQVA